MTNEAMRDEADRLRRHLRAQAVVNRQLHAQLTEATRPSDEGAKKGGGPGATGLRTRVVAPARSLWRRAEPLLPAGTAELARRQVKHRILGTPAPAPGKKPTAKKTEPPSAKGTASGGETAASNTAAQTAEHRGATAEDPEALARGWLAELNGGRARRPRPSLVRPPDGRLVLIEGDQARLVSSTVIGAALIDELGFARNVTEQDVATHRPGPPVELILGPGNRPHVIVGGRRRPVHGYPAPHPAERAEVERFAEGKPLDLAKANVARLAFEREAGRMGELTTRLPRPVAVQGTRVVRRLRRLADRA